MKVKIFSVRADENFRAIRVGDETRKLLANEYLEGLIQKFLDENPKVQIKHVQFTTVAIIPKQLLGIPLIQILIGKWRNLY